MKHSQEKCTAQQQIHAIQSRVMEVTQRLQPVQDKGYQFFTEVEGQGTEIEKVVTTAEQCLEGPINDEVIQEFLEQEVVSHQQVEVAQGVRTRTSETEVTQDESQVSVGGMLALHQVLRDPWESLTYFGTSKDCRR
jgi:uncharacterized protein YggU (UPF0235/DUF167 family)